MASQDYNQQFSNATTAPKEDTVMNILARVESLLDSAKKNEHRLENIRDMIGGSTPQPASDKPEMPVPASHVLFAASRIEQELNAHIDRMAGTIGRLERMI